MDIRGAMLSQSLILEESQMQNSKDPPLVNLAALNSKFGCLKFKVCTFRWLEMNFV